MLKYQIKKGGLGTPRRGYLCRKLMMKRLLYLPLIGIFIVGCGSSVSVSHQNLSLNNINIKKEQIDEKEWIKRDGCLLFNDEKSDDFDWNGECVDGFVEGYGELKLYKNGEVKTILGNFKRGKKSGQCNYSTKNGDSYQIIFVDGKMKYGTYKSPNGVIYKGEWRDGKANGEGTLIYPNGDVYIGHFVDNLPNGKGTYKYKNGDIYIGYWKNNKRDGKGRYEYKSGDVYDGEWVNNKKEGFGIYYYSNGDVYKGEWANNKANGKGVYKYHNGDIYDGEWVNDKREGIGSYLYANGDEYIGNWSNNRKSGEGTYRYADSGLEFVSIPNG